MLILTAWQYEPWAALIVGGLGGCGFMVVHFAMLRLRLDDPLDAGELLLGKQRKRPL